MSEFKFQPVIIIGAARSGTNMVRDLLTQIPRVATWPCDEINYVWRYGNASYPTDELRPKHVTPNIKHFIRNRFARLASKTGAHWIVEKTCANSLRVDFVREIVPEAKFVFLVRDGLDVAVSANKRWHAPLDLAYVLKKSLHVPMQEFPYYAARYLAHRVRRLATQEKRLPTWGPRFAGLDESVQRDTNLQTCFTQWNVCVESAHNSLSSLPRSHVHFLRYEDFVAHPKRHLKAMCKDLGISCKGGTLRELASQVFESSVGTGRNHPELQALETQTQTILHDLNVLWNPHELSSCSRAA
ncbi:sulfotransferase family protein [Bythopirellula polymerisocia]|uniref:Sulfotransferase domain protein n=1 Tax=Bythopirellula polymerisocia TaxID=2528003 RepID=A0A5C6CJX6_9BACT|nr:sulfotransferase [Bythopirellula polymerisocia]TWU24682.1 Sulfotransferase domain protein [Bythopirellula polymerisocia]